MKLRVEHAIIAVLVVALLYYVYKHSSLLRDLGLVSHQGNPQLKAVKEKHDVGTFMKDWWPDGDDDGQ
jgi:hypothetical protein